MIGTPFSSSTSSYLGSTDIKSLPIVAIGVPFSSATTLYGNSYGFPESPPYYPDVHLARSVASLSGTNVYPGFPTLLLFSSYHPLMTYPSFSDSGRVMLSGSHIAYRTTTLSFSYAIPVTSYPSENTTSPSGHIDHPVN